MDKTGTITEGRPQVARWIFSERSDTPAVLSALGALESKSEHPLARAVTESLEDLGHWDASHPEADEFEQVAGTGLTGRVGEYRLRVGNRRTLEASAAELPDAWREAWSEMEKEGLTVLVTLVQRGVHWEPAALAGLSDRVRDDSREALAALRKEGVRVTMLTGDGANLSQGQKQLLSIARVAVANPPVLILDEATSSIDTRTEYLVQKGMDALMEGRTVFVIAHRLSTIQNSDAIMVLDHGRIIERGSHEELIAKKGQYYQLYTGAFELE